MIHAYGWPGMFLLELAGQFFIFLRNDCVGIYSDHAESFNAYWDIYHDELWKDMK